MNHHENLDDISSTGGKPCAQPICRHSRDDHGDGAGVDTNCQFCACPAYISHGRMIGRRILTALTSGRPDLGRTGIGQ